MRVLLINISLVFILLYLFSDARSQNFTGSDSHNVPKIAIANAEKLAQRDSSIANAYEVAGAAFYKQYKYDSALYCLEEGIRFDLDTGIISCLCHSYIGDYFIKHNNVGKAKEEWHQAIHKGLSKDCIAWASSSLGQIYLETNSIDSIIFYFSIATELDSTDSFISGWENAYLGNMYMQKGNFKLAMACVNKAINKNVDSGSAYYAENTLLWILSNQNKRSEVLEKGYKLISKYISDPDPYLAIGVVYKNQKKYDSAKFYLQKACKLDNDLTWKSASGHIHLSEVYLQCSEKNKAIEELKRTIAINKTNSSVHLARKMLDSLGVETVSSDNELREPNWTIVDAKHITYYFQDTTNMTELVNKYVKDHEEAYIKINSTFQAVLPKKIIFYVWNDKALAKKILGRELGFSNSAKCITNIYIYQTIGHEMTHILSYWGWGFPRIRATQFINEGIAVAFDQSNDDKYKVARQAVTGKNVHTVLDIWNEHTDEFDLNLPIRDAISNRNSGNNYESILYPVGGAFITYLYEKSSPEQFKNLVKDQTVENAEKIYGKTNFTKMITEFNSLINLK